MQRALVLLVVLGLLFSLCACGSTVRQSVKAPAPVGGWGDHPSPSDDLGYHAYQHYEWIEDTPYGY
jgi:hypothetical protein